MASRKPKKAKKQSVAKKSGPKLPKALPDSQAEVLPAKRYRTPRNIAEFRKLCCSLSAAALNGDIKKWQIEAAAPMLNLALKSLMAEAAEMGHAMPNISRQALPNALRRFDGGE